MTVKTWSREYSCLSRGFGLPCRQSSAALYSSLNILQHGHRKLSESRESKVASAGIQIETGRRWSADS